MPSANGTNGAVHAWDQLPQAMAKSVKSLQKSLDNDPQWQAFIDTNAIVEPVTMGVASKGGDAILVNVDSGSRTKVSTGSPDQADYTLFAHGEQWEKFFDADPKAPYQSFVGLQGMNIKQAGVGVQGNHTRFAQYGHLTTRLLELLREGLHGPLPEDSQPEATEDHITGRYIYVDNIPTWGRTKIFYETSGSGAIPIVFLHTAGSDSRQYHGVMNDPRMMEKCTMIAFDLPAHGRSFPGAGYIPGNHTNNEDAYVGAIREVVKALKLQKPVICGASMAGQVCVAVAIRAEEVGAGGTVPLQGCDYLTMERQFNDKSPVVNQSLFNPDWIYGMMNPKAPYINRQLIWHMYSGQAYGIFHGDLDFYFGGFDARDRVSKINTNSCPIHFLTGVYDWSTTPEMSKATADKIEGAKFTAMEGLGHFPATENPNVFVGYLLEALQGIESQRDGGKGSRWSDSNGNAAADGNGDGNGNGNKRRKTRHS